MLALHGFTGDGRDFRPLFPLMQRPIFAPDLIGHGEAPPKDVTKYRIDAVADSLAEQAKGVVMGYSMGARLAMNLYLRHPQKIKGLVLISATPGIANTKRRVERRRSDEKLADRIESIGIRAFIEEWNEKPIIASQKRIARWHRSEMYARRLRRKTWGLANSLRGMGTGAMTPLWKSLPDFDLPVLLISGQEDKKFTRTAQKMGERLPNGRVATILGAGHCTHLEKPESTCAIIREFLSDIGE